MSPALQAQLLATATGLLLLTAILQVWRRSLTASIRLLRIQGIALALLVVSVGLGDPETWAVAGLVLVVKVGIIPWALIRTARATGAVREAAPLINPTAALLVGIGMLSVLVFPLLGDAINRAATPRATAEHGGEPNPSHRKELRHSRFGDLKALLELR